MDRITVERFAKDCPRGLLDLQEQLRMASYQPLPVKRVWIPKPGTTERRPLGIPAVRDRIVQTALRLVIEPIFEHRFAEHSYGFRPGRVVTMPSAEWTSCCKVAQSMWWMWTSRATSTASRTSASWSWWESASPMGGCSR